MTSPFARPALLYNLRSGSSDDAIVERLTRLCADHGMPFAATFTLPDGELPTAATLAKAGADLLVVLSGEGTVNAAAAALETWDGALLPLPGGTLNLFHKRLHGDLSPEDILKDALEIATGSKKQLLRSLSLPKGRPSKTASGASAPFQSQSNG